MDIRPGFRAPLSHCDDDPWQLLRSNPMMFAESPLPKTADQHDAMTPWRFSSVNWHARCRSEPNRSRCCQTSFRRRSISFPVLTRRPSASWQIAPKSPRWRPRVNFLALSMQPSKRRAKGLAWMRPMSTRPCGCPIWHDMAMEKRWPDFAKRDSDLGAKSMLALQLYVEEDNLGRAQSFLPARPCLR